MQCPRCNSYRIQRGYKDPPAPLRLLGMRQLLCNKCGLEFKGLDPLGRLERAPSFEIETLGTRRRAPRYPAHFPATIYLAERNPDNQKVTRSERSHGHCEAISKVGLTLSFVGARFSEKEICRPDRVLFVTVDLTNGPISAVVSVISRRRINEQGIAKWVVGVSFSNMSETDTARLTAYLDKRAEDEPVLIVE